MKSVVDISCVHINTPPLFFYFHFPNIIHFLLQIHVYIYIYIKISGGWSFMNKRKNQTIETKNTHAGIHIHSVYEHVHNKQVKEQIIHFAYEYLSILRARHACHKHIMPTPYHCVYFYRLRDLESQQKRLQNYMEPRYSFERELILKGRVHQRPTTIVDYYAFTQLRLPPSNIFDLKIKIIRR